MPYNTRRKSLSLPSLGIHVPVNRSSSNNNHNAQAGMMARPRPSSEAPPRPSKKLKRSHVDSSNTAAPTIGSRKCDSIATPTPSPGVQTSIETDEIHFTGMPEIEPVDLTGVNDEIVEAVLLRLQQTRNRPHLVKELTTVLTGKLAIVQQYVFVPISRFVYMHCP
jgi:hypothetical protein